MSDEEKVVVEETSVENVMETVVHDANEPVVSTKKLLEAGCHFGHQTRRWNPKMSKYIYGSKNGIYIIDLVKTAVKVQEAYHALRDIVSNGGKVLFVGTKPQAKDIIKLEAERSGSFYVSNRWLGGTLTNFKTIQKRIKYLKQLEEYELNGTYDALPKKEVSLLRKEKDKLLANLDGIKEMRKVPNAVFVIDPKLEHNAVAEARKLNIPVFALIDTNSDPDEVKYGIPANDDAVKSIQLITGLLADAVAEAKGGLTNYAYGVKVEDDVTMADGMNAFDKAEELRLIKAKKIEDANAAKKASGKKVTKKFVYKPRVVKEEAPVADAAPVEATPVAPVVEEKAVEVAAPVEEAPVKKARAPRAKKAAPAKEEDK